MENISSRPIPLRLLYGNGKYAGEFQKEAGKKNLDMVVANNLKVAGAGFETDTNVVTMITNTEVLELPIMNKEEVAFHIIDQIYLCRTLIDNNP